MSVVATPPARAKRKRGRETPTDMVRSMGLVMLIVVPLWFLARPPGSDEQKVRVVDPSSDVRSFAAASPGLPVPGALPAGWRATSSTLEPGALRVGWVTPSGQYAEYAASTAPAAASLGQLAGQAGQVGTVDVQGVTWSELSDADGHTSLVREVGGGTVVVGGLRETSALAELTELAGAVR